MMYKIFPNRSFEKKKQKYIKSLIVRSVRNFPATIWYAYQSVARESWLRPLFGKHCLPIQHYEKNRPATREKKQLLFHPLLPKFHHYRDNTFPRRIFSQGSLLLHCISSSSPFDDNEEKDTRRNDRPPLPPLLLYAVSPEAARAPNILFGRQQYPRRAIVGGAGNGVVCSMADLPLV